MQPPADIAVPNVWRVTDLAGEEAALPSGHAALDKHLPGGGWPVGSLVELLQDRPEAHAWQLLLPALASAVKDKGGGPVVLVGAPAEPFLPSLAAQGLPADRLLWIRADKPAARLWASEQALRCADVIALIAWLPQVRVPELRRLHLAARQHRKLLFVVRGTQAMQQASPAPLRIVLEGVDELQLRIVKRKGPPVDQPLKLRAHAARVEALLASRRRRTPAPVPVPQPETTDRRSHVLDRLVSQP
jgi:protein ImuA